MRKYLVALALTLALASLESDATLNGTTSISHNIIYRQEQTILPVSTSTSSYDYWWPYPPGGVVTSAAVPTLSFSLPSTTLTSDTITTDEDIPITTLSAESSIATPIPTTSLSSTSSSTTIFHITALPAANTSTPNPVVHKLNPKSPGAFKITYLEPLFVIIGITLGSAIAWFCCGCLSARRGPRQRASSLEPGPAYVATQTEIDDDKLKYERGDRDMEAATAPPTVRGSPSKHSRRGPSYSNSRRSRLWLTRAMSTHSGDPVPGGEKVFSWPAPTPTPQGYEHEEDPFLAVPFRAKPTMGCPSPDPLGLVDLDEDDDVPYDTLRHKSIRRGILERLKFGTFRRAELEKGESELASESGLSCRRAHNRVESDVRVDEVKLPERTYSPSKERGGVGKDETVWVAGSGFRIVEEDLEAIREKVRVGDWGEEVGRPIDYSSGPAKEEAITWDGYPGVADDKYTALPVRKSPSKKGLGARGVRTPPGVPRVDSALLPVSPPQITSPPLESSLCFTPRMQASGSVQMGEGGQGPRNKVGGGWAPKGFPL